MSHKAIIITAPSGAGKTTIAQHLLHKFPMLQYSVSATTRPVRPGETDGIDYYFINTPTFKQKIEENAFIEYEQVYDSIYYGTLKSEVARLWQAGFVILFVVDVKGALHLAQYFGENALSIFIKAPDLDTLALRLQQRGTETPEKMQERIEKAKAEMQYESWFDRVLENDELEKAKQVAENMVEFFLTA